jgi:hypothetical protein
MGEAQRRMEMGLMEHGVQKQQTIQVDLTNATQKLCGCGCKYFVPVVAVYTVSALVSPIGKELTAQQPVLVCRDCGEMLK